VKFSLIIATKGRVDELAKAIDSIFGQTWREWEVILSDQNDDDRVNAFLAERGWSGRVIVVKSSAGASRGRNAGIERATGDILGFPDDDCAYPTALLENITLFFQAHPEYGFLTGRSFADDGGDGASRHARRASPIRRYSIYYQAIEFAFWVRRSALGTLRFDENLGTGSVTPWQADEGPDLVLRLEERGMKGCYDPAFAVWHPRLELGTARAIERCYRYACGSGFFLQKHRYPAWFFVYLLGRALVGAKLALLRFKRAEASYYWARVRGLWRGWRGYETEHRTRRKQERGSAFLC
jgi:glycosyltransferase involved in cell wall biosynthesis